MPGAVSGRVWDAWTGWGSEAGAVWSRWAAGGAGVPEGVIGGCDSAVGAGGKRCEVVMAESLLSPEREIISPWSASGACPPA